MEPEKNSTGPLSGLRVVEIGHFVAAPFCTRLLGDLGADVIKIEPPGGDPVRQWGAMVDGRSAWWSMHGRNKRCITLDLKQSRAKEVVLRLAANADALVENFRPGQLEKLGLGNDVLRGACRSGNRARVGVRAGWSLPQPRGVRRDRRGDGRAALPDQSSTGSHRIAAGARRRLDRRQHRRALRGVRDHGGALAARPAGRRLARAHARRGADRVGAVDDGGDAAGIRCARQNPAAGGRAHSNGGALERVPDEGRRRI